MREAIALIIVILMGAFAATQAQGATPHLSHTHDTITQRVVHYIDNDPRQDRNNEINSLLSALKTHQDDPAIASSLTTIALHLMNAQENTGRTPTYKNL